MYRQLVPPMLRNFRIVVPLVIGQTVVYWLLNHYPPLPSRTLPLTAIDRWIPFWIWTVWPYAALHVIAVLCSLSVRNRRVFSRLVVSFAISMAMADGCFALWPTHYLRPAPPTDPSLTSAAYRLLISVDTPQCCFPSIHIILPVLACTALWQDRRHGGIWPWLLAGVCLPAILTTKQHYVWDLLGGLAVAVVGIVISRRLVSLDEATCHSNQDCREVCPGLDEPLPWHTEDP
jgi:hypothetical protein